MDIPDGIISGTLEAKIVVHPSGNVRHTSGEHHADCHSFHHPDEMAGSMELLTWLDPQTIFLRGNLYFMGDLGWEIQEQNPQEKAIEEDRFWPTREKLRLKNWRWFAQRYADQIMTNLRYLRYKNLL